MALCCIGMQAKDTVEVWHKAVPMPRQMARPSGYFMYPTPQVNTDKKTGKTSAEWMSTENNSWHENIGPVKKVPTVADIRDIFPDMPSAPRNLPQSKYSAVMWQLEEGTDETVLHCYLKMPADEVTNIWLANQETVILDKETGTIYQSRRTVPAECYDKVFSVKAETGTILDFQIFFPKLAEDTREIAIYGVPAWYMRGLDVTLPSGMSFTGKTQDRVPQFHTPKLVKEAQDYDKNNHQSWSVYTDPHLISPVKDGTYALWLTDSATYLAEACEMNWKREYFGRGGNSVLIDSNGHQYKHKTVLNYPDDNIFWMEGYAGDYFTVVQVFEPLPLFIDKVTFVVPEGEPFSAWGANWSGKVLELDVQQLRNNQKLFEYKPRKVVK